jgi:ADP-ribose pyrophosphatase YjhB (NUDIX family)
MPRDARLKCFECGYVVYRSPQITAGCVLQVGNRVLLTRRAITPRIGFWTVPGGYVEEGESTEQGARRELEEEAGVRITSARLAAIYEIPQINQVCILYSAQASHCEPCNGAESSEVQLFEPARAPWEKLAFPTDRRIIDRLKSGQALKGIEIGDFGWGEDGRILMRRGKPLGSLRERGRVG